MKEKVVSDHFVCFFSSFFRSQFRPQLQSYVDGLAEEVATLHFKINGPSIYESFFLRENTCLKVSFFPSFAETEEKDFLFKIHADGAYHPFSAQTLAGSPRCDIQSFFGSKRGEHKKGDCISYSS